MFGASFGGAGMPTSATENAGRAQIPHLVGQQLSGRVKKFKDSWGFVNSDSFLGDLFIHTRSNATMGSVGVGENILFEVAEDPKLPGQFQAINASLIKEEMASLVGQQCRGWIKSFRGEWGLINSNRFEGDLFCGMKCNKQLPPGGLAQGQQVEFQVAPDDKGKNGLQAMNVKLVAGAAGGMMGGAQAGMMGMMGPGLPGMPAMSNIFGMSMPGMSMPGMSGKPRAEALIGRQCQGTIRSFKETWGFIISNEFDGDLFVGINSNAGIETLQLGDAVVFEIAQESNGKCKAVNVQGVGTSLAQLVGQRSSGVVRKFEGNWGFITSTAFAGDLFVGLNGNKHLTMPLNMGDQVEFMVQKSYGKSGSEATEVQVLGHGATPPENALAGLTGSGGQGGGQGGAGANPSIAALVDQQASGVVRKFDGNWGFITSTMFHGDLFVGLNGNKHLPMPPQMGDQVEFLVRHSSGKSQSGCEATELQVIGQGATPPSNPLPIGGSAFGHAADRSRSPMGRNPMAGAMSAAFGMAGGSSRASSGAAGMVGQILSGSIRSYRGEFGFATSPSFDGDLFVGNKSNPHLPRTLVEGDQIQFQVRVSPNGKAEAIDVQIF